MIVAGGRFAEEVVLQFLQQVLAGKEIADE